ncbi:retrovirus-related pol polyprotein from transposon TNT 1-94 [Tanacetum coccineum]
MASIKEENKTLIEATRIMLADSKLPTTFWAKAVNTACYVQNMVLVTKPHNKTPYELFLSRKPALGFMRPFGCPVTILNTIDHLGKFDGSGPNWPFDIDTLTKSMNYKPVVVRNQSNGNAGIKACDDADDGSKPSSDDEKKVDEDPRKDSESIDQEKDDNVNSTNNVSAASINEVNAVGGKTIIELLDDPNMPALEDYSIFDLPSDDQDNGVESDMNNLDTTIQCKKQTVVVNSTTEAEYVAASSCCGQIKKAKEKYTRVPLSSVPSDNVADEAVNEEMDDSLAEPNEAGSQETTSGGGPRRHDTMGDTIAQTRFNYPRAHDVLALSLYNQQPVLNLKMRIFNRLMKMTWKNWILDGRYRRNQGRRSYGDNGRSNAPTNESSSQALVAQDGLGGYDWSNDFEVEPVNYALMAISSSSSSSSSDNEVQKCSKQCIESFKTLQNNSDSEREKHSRARLEIQGYELALESLESRILVHDKNELAWGEKYEFQNYELKCREIKINNLNLELEKIVKEIDELKLKIEKWEESSKNLDESLNKSSDEENTPINDRFSKADGFHDVPPPITRNFLTLRADISFAEKTNEANTQKPKTVYELVNRDKVIIEDWNSDDEDDVSEV